MLVMLDTPRRHGDRIRDCDTDSWRPQRLSRSQVHWKPQLHFFPRHDCVQFTYSASVRRVQGRQDGPEMGIVAVYQCPVFPRFQRLSCTSHTELHTCGLATYRSQ